jgi:F0F1-type ATP synthase beta subunit
LAGHAESIRQFASQPFYVAESFTGMPGTTVTLDEATRELSVLVLNAGHTTQVE